MDGYVALGVVRQAPERVAALALISTSARPDSPEQLASRPGRCPACGFHLVTQGHPVGCDRPRLWDVKTFPVLFNTWTGVRSVNPLWLRAAGAMGAEENSLFWKVIIPGASPFIITGMRQAFLRCWIAVVGAEMIAASDWGLGWVIFDAKEFLQTDVMMASLIVIGGIGFVFERVVFGSLERFTVLRWGMVRAAKA